MTTPRVLQYAEEIAFWHGVEPAAVLGPSRDRRNSRARGDVMRRLRSEGFTSVQIGRWLNRDHSTVLYWVKSGR